MELRRQLTGCGHRSGSGHVLQVIAPEKAGGMGIEPAWCTAAAALCDEVARGLAGRDGEPARLALESFWRQRQTCTGKPTWSDANRLAELTTTPTSWNILRAPAPSRVTKGNARQDNTPTELRTTSEPHT